MTFPTYYSQCGEDKWLHEHGMLAPKGVYIDVGASDGITSSNTKFVADRGWSGLLIEPDFNQLPALYRNRPNTFIEYCAVRAYEGTTRFAVDPHGFLSHITDEDDPFFRTVTVRCHTLFMLMRFYHMLNIELLSVDVEGYEVEALTSLGFEFYKPKIVIAEWNTLGHEPNDKALIDFFADKPYELAYRTDYNLIFISTVDKHD